MVKENYFKILNYLWDLKEAHTDVIISLRQLQGGMREPIDIFMGNGSRFYLDVIESGFVVIQDEGGAERMSYEELVDLIEGSLEEQ